MIKTIDLKVFFQDLIHLHQLNVNIILGMKCL
jgi:hypothetical protein